MKYTCTVAINKPIADVVSLWENESNFKEWQDGFESIELLSGEIGQKDAKSKIILDDNRRIELIETIISNNLPDEKVALYEHIHMDNLQTTRFKPLGEEKTEYISIVEYTKFKGFMVKLMAKLFPSKFKAQSQKWMDQFKAFAEKIAPHVDFVIEPYVRFKGLTGEQTTMFFYDPCGNALEFKAFRNDSQIFAK